MVGVNEQTVERLLVDPSVLLSELGLTWLQEDAEARRTIVVSAAFYQSLNTPRDRLLYPLLPSGDLATYLERRELLAKLLDGVDTFSHRDAGLSGGLEDVKRALLELSDPDAAVFADEWTFLQSRSWMIAALHRPLDAFRAAGAIIVEYGEKLRDELIQAVVRPGHIPQMITPTFLARVGGKWLILGGSAAVPAVAGGLLGGAAGMVTGTVLRPVVRAFDP